MHKRGTFLISLICLLVSIGLFACSKDNKPVYSDYEHNSDIPRITKAPDNLSDNTYHSEAGLVAKEDNTNEDEVSMTAKVTVSSLNIRSAPSLESTVIDNVKINTILHCLEQGEEWHKILYNDGEAYVYAPYVQISTNGAQSGSITVGTDNNSSAGNPKDYSHGHLKDIEIVEQYTYDMMCEDIELLESKYKDCFASKPIAATADKRFIYELIVGNGNASKHVVVYAGMCGSEHMTSLLAMKQIEHYLYEYDKHNDIFKDTAVHVFPMVNPDGVTLSQFGDEGINEQEYRDSVRRWYFRDIALRVNTLGKPDYYSKWNANLKGVDIYYNFPYKWEEFQGNIVPGSELYKGSFSLSEEESNALYKQIKKIMPVAVIGYHASGEEILWNFGQTGEVYTKSYTLFEKINKLTGYKESKETIESGFDAWIINEWNIPAVMIKVGTKAPLDTDEFDGIWSDIRDLWEVFN